MKLTLTFDLDLTLRELAVDRKHLRHVDFGIKADANKRNSVAGSWRPNRKWKVKKESDSDTNDIDGRGSKARPD